MASDTRKLTYHLTNDYMTLTQQGQAVVINQPTGVLRVIQDEEDNTDWMFVPSTDPSVDLDFLFTGGNAGHAVSIGSARYQQADDWEIA